MKIINLKTFTNIPQVIQLTDDFSINGKIYSKYTLTDEENPLNFFFLDVSNITNDYRYMPIDNLCCDVNDYPIHRILIDNKDTNTVYVLFRVSSTDYVTKIQKKDNEYNRIATTQLTALSTPGNTGSFKKIRDYYAKKHLEFIAQTDNNIVIYDNFSIRNISKKDFTLKTYILREPVLVDKVENDNIFFINIDYTQYCIYNAYSNTITVGWTNILTEEKPDVNYSYKFINDTDLYYPLITPKFFMQGFKINNYINTNDYNYASYMYDSGSDGTGSLGVMYYARIIRKNATYTTNGDYHIYNGGSLTQSWFYYNRGDTNTTQIHSSMNWTSGVVPLAYEHRILNQNLYIKNKDGNEYVLTTTDSNGFIKFYIEEYGENLLIIHNGNSVAHLILLNKDLEELITYDFNLAFKICDKYNNLHFCIIMNDNSCFVYQLDIENHTINKCYTLSNINAFSIQNNNIWFFNNSKYYLQTYGTAVNITAVFEKEEYSYEDTDIQSYIIISSSNFIQEPTSNKVKITLSGPCKFENDTQSLITYTELTEKQIPVIITGSGKCECQIKEV